MFRYIAILQCAVCILRCNRGQPILGFIYVEIAKIAKFANTKNGYIFWDLNPGPPVASHRSTFLPRWEEKCSQALFFVSIKQPLSVVDVPTPKKNMHIAMCNWIRARAAKCILLCAIWIRATKNEGFCILLCAIGFALEQQNAYCYVQYGFARPKMKVEVEERS